MFCVPLFLCFLLVLLFLVQFSYLGRLARRDSGPDMVVAEPLRQLLVDRLSVTLSPISSMVSLVNENQEVSQVVLLISFGSLCCVCWPLRLSSLNFILLLCFQGDEKNLDGVNIVLGSALSNILQLEQQAVSLPRVVSCMHCTLAITQCCLQMEPLSSLFVCCFFSFVFADLDSSSR